MAAELSGRCADVGPGGGQSAGERAVPAASVRIDCRPLAGQPPLVVRELCKLAWGRAGWPLQAMGFAQWSQLAQLATDVTNSPLNLPGNVRRA